MTRENKELLSDLLHVLLMAFFAGAIVDSLLSALHPGLPIAIPILIMPLYYYLQWRLRK